MLHINGIWISVGWEKLAFSQTCIPVICDQVRKRSIRSPFRFSSFSKTSLLVRTIASIYFAAFSMQWILRTGFSLLKPLTWITSSAVIPQIPPSGTSRDYPCLPHTRPPHWLGSEMLLHLSDDTDGHPSQNSASGFHDMKYMRDPLFGPNRCPGSHFSHPQ